MAPLVRSTQAFAGVAFRHRTQSVGAARAVRTLVTALALSWVGLSVIESVGTSSPDTQSVRRSDAVIIANRSAVAAVSGDTEHTYAAGWRTPRPNALFAHPRVGGQTRQHHHAQRSPASSPRVSARVLRGYDAAAPPLPAV